MNESRVFAAALKLATPAERAAYLDAACAGDPGLRAGVEALLRAHEADPGFLERPAASVTGTARAPAVTAPGPVAAERPGAVLAAGTSCWSRSARAAWAPSSWPSRPHPVRAHGGAEAHQAGDGHPAGHRPLRGRAAGAGPDGPPEHRQGPRRRGHAEPAGRTSSWSWSRACPSPGTATSGGCRSASGWSCSCRSARRCSTPTRRASSTATSSPPTCWWRPTTACRS